LLVYFNFNDKQFVVAPERRLLAKGLFMVWQR
jgi:hypothetical protein